MEWLEQLEVSLDNFAKIAQFCLETLSILTVVVGLIKTIQFAIALNSRHRHDRSFSFNQIRLRFGSWLALTLEFQLGADIVATTIAPTLEQLGKLALIAAIRTFLNYFLGKEVEVEYERQKQQSELAVERKPIDE